VPYTDCGLTGTLGYDRAVCPPIAPCGVGSGQRAALLRWSHRPRSPVVSPFFVHELEWKTLIIVMFSLLQALLLSFFFARRLIASGSGLSSCQERLGGGRAPQRWHFDGTLLSSSFDSDRLHLGHTLPSQNEVSAVIVIDGMVGSAGAQSSRGQLRDRRQDRFTRSADFRVRD
jgi:hypothetical protein